jgi:hypothetical protein
MSGGVIDDSPDISWLQFCVVDGESFSLQIHPREREFKVGMINALHCGGRQIDWSMAMQRRIS